MRVGLLLWTLGNLYVAWRAATLPWLRTGRRRVFLAIVALLLWGSFLAERGLEGVLPAPLRYPLALLGADGLAIVLWAVAALLVVDVVTLGGLVLRRWVPAARLAAFGVTALFAVIGVVQALRPPVVRDYEVRLPGLPRDADGLVAVGISDLHLGTLIGARWLAARVRQVEALHPDVIVVLGDVLEGDATSEAALLPGLRALSAPLGVWAVTGNHEHYGRRAGEGDRLAAAGFRPLHDTWAEIRPGLVLVGVDDLTRRRRSGAAGDPIGAALRGRPAGAATILLSHSPLQAERAAAGGVGLMLAAHTHDGQIWPFGMFTAMNYPLMGGRYTVDGMPVIVCRGTGTWGPRMRLWRPSEILRVTLRSAA